MGRVDISWKWHVLGVPLLQVWPSLMDKQLTLSIAAASFMTNATTGGDGEVLLRLCVQHIYQQQQREHDLGWVGEGEGVQRILRVK